MDWTKEIQDALAAPFPEDEIEFLPRAATNDRALALPHIDARTVMRRLDAVVGCDGWHFTFEPLTPDCKKVKGYLTVLGITKCDAGEASTEDEPLKSAVSDSLKRCAVHFGIARYLYCLPQIWADYDSGRRRFKDTPRMPHGAVEKALAVCGWHPPKPTTKTQVQERVRGVLESIPTPGPAPIVGGNGGEVSEVIKGETRRLVAACHKANVKEPAEVRLVAGTVLKRTVTNLYALSLDELEEATRWVSANPAEAEAIIACPDEQSETLPLEVVAGGVPAGLATT